MITAADAQKITEDSFPEAARNALLEEVEKRIRGVAANGQAYLRVEGLTDAQSSFLRRVMTERGFNLSDTGLVLYW